MNPAMHGVWFAEQAAVAGTSYHMALGIWFDGDLDRPGDRLREMATPRG